MKTIHTLLLSAVTVLSLCACGNKNNPTPSNSNESTSQAESGIVINFWHTFGKTPADAIEAKGKEFSQKIKAQEGVDVTIKFTYKGGYTDMPGLVTKGFATGDNPTIAVAYPDHVADYFAAEQTPGEFVVNLKPYAEDPNIGFGKEAFLGDNEGIDDFVEAFIEEGQNYEREGMYSLPYMKSSEVMFYNKTALRRAMTYYDSSITSDVQIEQFMNNLTWDTFMDLCEVINDNKTSIISTLEIPAFYDSDGNFIISKMIQNGIGFSSIDSNGKGRIDFNGVATSSFTPSAEQTTNYNKTIQLLTELKSQYDEGLLTTKGAFGEYGSNNFVNQKTMFSIGSSGGAGYNFPSSATFEVGICKVPASNNNPLYVTQGPTLCVLNNSKATNNDLLVKYAWKFLKYITNDEVNSVLCVDGSEGYIPVRYSAYSTQRFLSFMRDGESYAKVAKTVINEIDGHYLNTAVFTGSASLREYMAGALADVLLGKKTPTEALNNAISETIKKM